MPPADFLSARRLRLAGPVTLWLAVFLTLGWLTSACLFGDVEVQLGADQIRGGRVARVNHLIDPRDLWPGGFEVELLEDGRPLGPHLDSIRKVPKLRGGAYAVATNEPPGMEKLGALLFSASDDSVPRLNGRRYLVRFPRRQLRAAAALLLAGWILLPAAAVGWTRAPRHLPRRPTMAWAVALGAGVYSLFAVQAWLPPANARWLLAVGLVGLSAAVARLFAGRLVLPRWLPWVAALLGWAACSSLAGTSYASPRTAASFWAISVGGLLTYCGLRGAHENDRERGTSLLLGLFMLAAVLSLARDAGFDLAGSLASLRMGPRWTAGSVNPWTTKFLGHWLLVIAWGTLAALGWKRRGTGRGLALVSILGTATIGLNGSKSAIVALLVSAAMASAALRWPGAVRRLLITGLLAGVLLAPLLAAVPWRVHTSGLVGAMGNDGLTRTLELDIRGGVWEFSRRLVSLRPLAGWGFGASATLPGRNLPVTEALGLDPEGQRPKLARHPVLAGGHPHNAALLTWLDLGLIGALLAGGLLVTLGRSLAALEGHRGVHASLVGLLTVAATYLAINYPVWEPEVASILWMSAVLASVALPNPEVGRRELLRHAAAALLILAVGGALLAQQRMSRWRFSQELVRGEVGLDREAGLLRRGDEMQSLEHAQRVEAGAKLVEPGAGDRAAIHGWVYGPGGEDATDPVLVFVGAELTGVVWPERPSPEAFARAGTADVRALLAGFWVPVDRHRVDLQAPVTVVVLRAEDALAVELPPLTTGSRVEAAASPGDAP